MESLTDDQSTYKSLMHSSYGKDTRPPRGLPKWISFPPLAPASKSILPAVATSPCF